MISTAILYILSALLFTLTLPFRLLPDVVLPDGVAEAISEASGSLAGLNTIVPIDVLLNVFKAVILLEIGILAFKGLNWVIRKIPGVN
ncbi:MAG: hypothetical protein WC310_05850 [Patescibacteria group bacterium]|jgi:hypothetical protein